MYSYCKQAGVAVSTSKISSASSNWRNSFKIAPFKMIEQCCKKRYNRPLNSKSKLIAPSSLSHPVPPPKPYRSSTQQSAWTIWRCGRAKKCQMKANGGRENIQNQFRSESSSKIVHDYLYCCKSKLIILAFCQIRSRYIWHIKRIETERHKCCTGRPAYFRWLAFSFKNSLVFRSA